jgi:hypothetical protein
MLRSIRKKAGMAQRRLGRQAGRCLGDKVENKRD